MTALIIVSIITICVFWMAGVICLYTEARECIKTKRQAVFGVIIPLYAIWLFGAEEIEEWWSSLK